MAQYLPNHVMIGEISQMIVEIKTFISDIISMPVW